MNTIYPDKGAEIWLRKYARKNHWRVAAWLDLDDMVQEGYLAYYETRMRYPTAVEPKHIQALFSLVFRSKIENLVRAKTKQVDEPCYFGLDGNDRSYARGVINEGPILSEPPSLDSPESRMLMLKMPKEIRSLIALFDSSKDREELQKPLERYSDGRRETLNERFCKLLGLESNNIDVIGMTRDYLMGV